MVYFCSAATLDGEVSANSPPAACQDEPGRQFLALDQHHIGPAHLGQMIEHAAAGHSAANDNNLGMGFHRAVQSVCALPDWA